MLEARTDAEAMRLLAQADLFLQTGETVESRSSREAEAAQAYSRDTGHINPDYGKEVDDIKSGRRIRPAVLGMPSNMLLRSGIPNHPLIITKGTIEKDMVGRHNLTLEQIKRLPYRLGYPLMVFKSSDVNNPDRSVALINDAEKYPDGREEPIVVAIEPNGRVERIRVNEIKSAYGKENIGTALTNWTREGLLVSAQKKIAERWLTTRGLQFPNVVQAINSDSTVNLSEPDPSSQEKNTPPLFSRMGDDAVPDRVLALQSESLKDDFIRAIMNDKIGLKRLQEAIRDTKDVLTDGSNTYAMPVSHRANTPGGIGRGPLAGWL
jgi:hypothetical protein